jgi:hypothetical protein
MDEGATNGSRLVVALLLLASTAFFVMGVVQEHRRTESEQHRISEGAHADEGAQRAEETPDPNSELPPSLHDTESVFGIDLEATWLIGLAGAVSVLLALAVLVARSRALLLVVAAVCIVFVALDVREVVHQLDSSSAGLVVIAVVTALGHLASGGLAARLVRQPSAP